MSAGISCSWRGDYPRRRKSVQLTWGFTVDIFATLA
jgi:hypothetical protein